MIFIAADSKTKKNILKHTHGSSLSTDSVSAALCSIAVSASFVIDYDVAVSQQGFRNISCNVPQCLTIILTDHGSSDGICIFVTLY